MKSKGNRGVRFEFNTVILKCWSRPSHGHGSPVEPVKHHVGMRSEMFSIIAFKSNFLTEMNCVFWISMGFVKLVSCWQAVSGTEGALVTGLGSIWL